MEPNLKFSKLATEEQVRGTLAGFLMWPFIEDKKYCQEVFARLFCLLDSGKLSPRIDKIFSLSEANEAHERIIQRKNIGKVLLRNSH